MRCRTSRIASFSPCWIERETVFPAFPEEQKSQISARVASLPAKFFRKTIMWRLRKPYTLESKYQSLCGKIEIQR